MFLKENHLLDKHVQISEICTVSRSELFHEWSSILYQYLICGKPRWGQQCIFDYFGGQWKLGGWEAPEGLNPPPTNRALFCLYWFCYNNRKLVIWRKWQADKDNVFLKQRYTDITKQCRKAIYDFNVVTEESLVDAENIGKFYKHVNKKLATKTGIGVLKSDTGTQVTDPADQADMLNSYFSTTFVDDDGVLPAFPARTAKENFLAYIAFSSQDISKSWTNCARSRLVAQMACLQCFWKKLRNSLVSHWEYYSKVLFWMHMFLRFGKTRM